MQTEPRKSGSFRKLKDFVIYREQGFYSSFPAVAAVPGGKIIVAFRRAPNYHGMPGISQDSLSHYDCNSQIMSVTSADGANSWSAPNLLYAPPDGASQDGGLYYDGKYLYANSFIWGHIPRAVERAMRKSGTDEFLYGHYAAPHWFSAAPYGSYLLRSGDCGTTWQGPFYPDPAVDGSEVIPGRPRRMHNRANLCRGADGSLLWGGQLFSFRPDYHSSVVLYRSTDDGKSFQYLGTPAADQDTAVFEEPFLYITPAGKYVMLIRCHRDCRGNKFKRSSLFVSESTDSGRSWSEPRDCGFHVEPAAAHQLPDGRALVVYGYRKKPFGIRAKICDPELENIAEAPEIIIRDDGGQPDTGYPWITSLGGNRFLIVYYINHPKYCNAGGIEGSIIEIGE